MLREQVDKKEKENEILEEELEKVGFCGYVYFSFFFWGGGAGR